MIARGRSEGVVSPCAPTEHGARMEADEHAVDDIVGRLRAGERSALAEVYDRHHETLRRFATRLLADEHAAEDLVHDTFLALPKAVMRFEGRSTLRTFLVSIALNRCRHHVRAAARRRKASERLMRLSVPKEPPDPDARYRDQELAARLARALDRLPLDQRIAFVLCAVEERSGAEAAAIVGTSEGTIRTRLLRARRKLQALLQDDEGGEA